MGRRVGSGCVSDGYCEWNPPGGWLVVPAAVPGVPAFLSSPPSSPPSPVVVAGLCTAPPAPPPFLPPRGARWRQ